VFVYFLCDDRGSLAHTVPLDIYATTHDLHILCSDDTDGVVTNSETFVLSLGKFTVYSNFIGSIVVP
jgi:hypothetical protein